ncbi:protein of unknown function [Legionella hackeliae]|uniref:Uncharacterized protein n=1 Tax=Legionella hackeliae TaxID=449 RepID=A0A0A8UT87_LEGHA|nr:protein of unknown function [Legionella hackeliae]
MFVAFNSGLYLWSQATERLNVTVDRKIQALIDNYLVSPGKREGVSGIAVSIFIPNAKRIPISVMLLESSMPTFIELLCLLILSMRVKLVLFSSNVRALKLSFYVENIKVLTKLVIIYNICPLLIFS